MKNFEHLPVEEVMNKQPITVGPNVKVDRAASIMKENKIGSLLVIEEGKAVGIVTESDIIHKVVAKNKKPSELTVRKIMTSPMITIKPDLDICEAAKIMADTGVRKLPVMKGKKLIGILTEHDILRVSPTLIEITREYARMNSSETLPNKAFHVGYCEICGTYSEKLQEIDGTILCSRCEEE